MGPGEVRSDGARATRWVVGGAMVATIALRIPLLDLPAWPDEGGFLLVGGGWRLGGHAADGGLYGGYWVDRPPVLITLYGLAERLGGLLALRLLGALAAALTVACVAWIAHSVAGNRAAAWAAVTGAALLCTPLHWSFMVDGELVAAPFVAAGIGCVVRGLVTGGRRGLLLQAVGGVLAVAAILTKQNLADVFVFVAVALLARLLSRSLRPGDALRHAAAFAAGALAGGAVVAAWTLAHGTRLGPVFYAMYPFRLDAAEASASRVGSESAFSWDRLGAMTTAALLSGLLLLAVWVTVAGLRRRNRDAYVLALLVVLAFDVFSVAAGTSYWLHYLIQPVVPVAALTGIVAARGSFIRVLGVAAGISAVIAWAVLLTSPPRTAQELVGEAIADVSAPQDTIVTLPGQSNVNYAAGLDSPYPHLWALPARTLDPRGRRLERLLAGPEAPTWVVSFVPVRRTPPPGSIGAAIREHYRPVARICGATVFLRADESRADPVPDPRPDATADSRCTSIARAPSLSLLPD